MVKVELVLHGHVQGVFFRANIKEKAEELKLTGTVCNKPDGSVKLVAQGRKDVVDELVDFCINGFENALVEDVDVDYSDDEEDFDNFSIIS